MSERSPTWRIAIDTGGTFTDCVAVDPDGRTHTAKLLSSSALRGRVERIVDDRTVEVSERWSAPASFVRGFRFRVLGRQDDDAAVTAYDPTSGRLELDRALSEPVPPGTPFEVTSDEPAPVVGARLVTATAAGDPLPPLELRLATTLGTNALLTRRGSDVALFITDGFGDLLRIGSQQRPELFALEVRRPEPLTAHVIEVGERVASDGTVTTALELQALTARVDELVAAGVRTAAVALLNAHRLPQHERQVVELLLERGFLHVSSAADLAPRIQLLPRAETAVVDAYLGPIMSDYLGRIAAAVNGNDSSGAGDGSRLHVMTSAGGLVRSDAFRARDSLLSGPAGGVAGAALRGRALTNRPIISFDMGGTSTDVARTYGDFEYVFEHRVGDAHLVGPALAIETVAAGGGSICWFDGRKLRVGPASAGAAPGPACYGAGGPLTVTDVNLLLGRLDPDGFEIPVDVSRAEAALQELLKELRTATGVEVPEPASVLAGLIDIVNENMADAIRRVSVGRGYDPVDHALVAFGGAGGQHATAVASLLGIATVIVPADAGLLSAIGVAGARIERFAEREVLAPLADVLDAVDGWTEALDAEAVSRVAAEGVAEAEIEIRRRMASLRFVGQDSTVTVDYLTAAELEGRLRDRYNSLYGYLPERAIELETLRVVASTKLARREASAVTPEAAAAKPFGVRRSWRGNDGYGEVACFRRAELSDGATIDGPALVFERHGASFIDPGWSARVEPGGALVIDAVAQADDQTGASRADASLEAIELELFSNRFRAIAEDMGALLRKTALSTNIKERLDFSCAVLDPHGALLSNAPHIPVHLGSLGPCVQKLRETTLLGPGDMIVTNHPAYGGSHLPDVTVVTPVHGKTGSVIGYVASRAHHAELGGSRPGSMPPSATSLAEEGVVLPPTYVRRGKVIDWTDIRKRLTGGPYPSRNVEENIADLHAAVAAAKYGAEALRALADKHGEDTVRRYMEALQDHAEVCMRDAVSALPAGRHEAVETLDDGAEIRVAIDVDPDAGEAKVSFAGSAPVHPGNLNATPAIVRSALLYVLRLLIAKPLPLNDGLLRPVTLDIPRGMLNPRFGSDPAVSPAIVGGNVETSQRIVDTLLKALGVMAASQGTMNNVLFGDQRFAYYETIGGGAGAGPSWHGADAVHSHMTNTRITDPELLEHRYPVRVESFRVRRGSGGAGRNRGGDGAVREITFLEPMSLSVVSQRRGIGPYGLDGGGAGRPGCQRLIRASGEVVELAAIDEREVEPGDRFVIETPGGGGYGRPE